MRFSKLATIIYAARFLSAAFSYKTAHIKEGSKGFICHGDLFSEANYGDDKIRALKVLKHSHNTPFDVEMLQDIFVSEKPENFMMYDNSDAKGHYLFLLPSLTKVYPKNSYDLRHEYHLLLDDSGRTCALMLWKIKITPKGKSSEEPTYEICSVHS